MNNQERDYVPLNCPLCGGWGCPLGDGSSLCDGSGEIWIDPDLYIAGLRVILDKQRKAEKNRT